MASTAKRLIDSASTIYVSFAQNLTKHVMLHVSEETKRRVLDAVPRDRTATPAEIHSRVGMWAPATVRKALLLLLSDGLVEASGPKGKREYRRIGIAD